MPRTIDEDLRLRLAATEAITASVSRDMANPPWEDASPRILILRLSPLADVETSTSHLVLFSECRRELPGAYVDFGFFPAARDRALLSSQGHGLFYGLESGREAADFDLVLISNSFALELVNLPYLFADTGIPKEASARAASGGAPILILGGSNASCVGSLLVAGEGPEEGSDCLVDGIFFGEAEGALGDIARILGRVEAPRGERLEEAGSIEGLWIAGSGKAASRRAVLPFPPPLVTYPALNLPVASAAKLQISAGCPGYCTFCLEGWESRPYRELPPDEILRAARELKAATGASTLEVYSYNFNAHSRVYELVFELNRLFRRVNFMSQRLDILADSPDLAPFELAADKRSFTLGIEGVSERMRSFYRKGIDARQIDAAIAALSVPATRELKLFYIVAGIETDEDIDEFAADLARIADARDRLAPGTRVLASAGYLVRLPFTPLQYAPLCLDRQRLEGIADRMKAAAEARGIEFRLAADFDEYWVDQVLALGGRALSPWLARCPSEGIVYDGTLSRGSRASLEAFANGASLLGAGFEAEKDEAWKPPLSFADENGAALRGLYLRSSTFAPSLGRIPRPSGGGAAERQRLERLMEAKRRFASILVRLTFPRELEGSCAEYRSAWALRAIFKAMPEAVAQVFDAEDALAGKDSVLEATDGRYWGEALYRLVGSQEGRLAEAARAAGFAPCGEGEQRPRRVDAELVLPAAFAREAEAALKAYLAEERLSFVERRAEGSAELPERRLEIAARDLRKAIVLEAILRGPGRGDPAAPFSIRLALGTKARLADCLSRLDSRAARASSLRILSIES